MLALNCFKNSIRSITVPKISVIVPIYKVEEYLKRAVDSILQQTFSDLEIILVDDGSPDNCGLMCEEYAKIDSRIKVVHKTNGGLSSARNAGLDVATGEYIGFVDSDDWIHPQMYEYLYKCATKYDLDITTCRFEKTNVFNPQNYTKYDGFATYEVHDSLKFLKNLNLDIFYQYSPSVCTKLYKKEVFDNLRFEEGKLFEDTIIMIPTFLKASKIGYTDKVFYYYFQNRQGSIMNYDFTPKYFTASIQHVYLSLRNSNAIEASYIFEQHYLRELMKMYNKVLYKYPIFKKDFNKFLADNKKITYSDIFKNKRLCKMEKVAFSIFKINKKIGLKIYNKFFY